jgi:hypothetical protein
MSKKVMAKDLIFISRILRDGSGVEPALDMNMHNRFVADEVYKLNRLSITHDTYIACAFNSYVVKLKETP